MAQTRRRFIQKVGASGGYGAAYAAMQALGLLPPAEAFAGGAPDLAAGGGGGGAKVVILGAGVAGLSAAYELRKAGYDCTILEARARTGGRSWTVRRGDAIEMTDGSRQVCAFEDRPHHYFNAGPARLPSHHQAVLGYCRELGVELEVEVNVSRSALLLNPDFNGGRPIRLRQAVNDTRGHVAELLGKAIDRGALNEELGAADRDRMTAFLKTYGDLRPDRTYGGSTRSGFSAPPGAGDVHGTAVAPLDMGLLLDEAMWDGVMFEDIIDMQATMFQPRGGMDRIPAAFAKALGPSVIKRSSEVRQIRKTATGVAVAYRDLAAGQDRAIDAAYCLCTIPLPVLCRIDADFSRPYAEAIARTAYGDSIKIAWEAPRFWEGPKDQIYGGISFVKAPSSLVWYPSYGMHTASGVLLGAYASGPAAARLGALPRADQIALTRKMIDQLHPGSGPLLKNPLQVQWSKIPYNLGPWVQWPDGDPPDYALLGEPDGPIYFAGEYLSHVGAWQEGAIRSAHRAIGKLDAAHRAGRPVAASRAFKENAA